MEGYRVKASARIDSVELPIIPTIAAMVRDNPGCISLGQGVVSYGPPPEDVARLPALMADLPLHKYQAVGGLPALCDALSDKLARVNRIDVSQGFRIMVTAGSNMAFLNAVLAVGDPGDEFILPLPYYFNQEMAIRMCGCVPVAVTSRDDYQLDIDAIESAITKRTRAVVTVSPNNPTGVVYHPEDLMAINRLCKRYGLYHFSDEAYEYFTYDGAQHFSAASQADASEHSLSFYSFSKNYGMASWRVGYVVYPEHLHEAMNKVQDTNLICAPVVSQLLAIEVLKRPRQAIDEQVARLAQVRSQVYDLLASLRPLVDFHPTKGAFYVMVSLPGVDDRLAFNQFLAREYKVACVPGFAFGLDNTQNRNLQRLSYG
ncbi:MAG: aminotransferase class I/II-fold pyridoxal phosphate-dependent enzyme, partial [Betaproteobacteria bacterium]|nr:aminotransferase class I/II-fold pyridoxal phosphate-dependent enzyme [Betaproteobacteria bacterium]